MPRATQTRLPGIDLAVNENRGLMPSSLPPFSISPTGICFISRASRPRRTFFAALAAASALGSGALAHAEQRPVDKETIVDRAVEARTPVNPGGTTGATFFGCPDAHTPYDYVAYCPADVGLVVAEAERTPPPPPSAGGCALPSEPWGIPAALDAAISGPADKDRACMKALLIPEARLMFASVNADGAPSYRLETLVDWMARTRTRGHVMLEEKQLNFRVDRYGDIAHLWSLYALRSDGKAVARGINSIEAVRQAGGWRVVSMTVQAESASAPLPGEYLP
jgi:hypothetical protein